MWQYLIGASARDILALPDLEVGENVDTLDVCQEARWLIGLLAEPWIRAAGSQNVQ